MENNYNTDIPTNLRFLEVNSLHKNNTFHMQVKTRVRIDIRKLSTMRLHKRNCKQRYSFTLEVKLYNLELVNMH